MSRVGPPKKPVFIGLSRCHGLGPPRHPPQPTLPRRSSERRRVVLVLILLRALRYLLLKDSLEESAGERSLPIASESVVKNPPPSGRMGLDRGRMLDGSRGSSTLKKPSVFEFLIRRIPIQANVYWPWTDKKCEKPRGYWSWTDGRIKYTSVPPPNLPRQLRSGSSRGDGAPNV